MKIALCIIGYFMMVLIAFYVLCIVTGDDSVDDDDLEMLVFLSFIWPVLIAGGMVILPFKVMQKAAEATVKSLEKRRRENDEH